jgi:hypothetical protein
MRGTRHIEANPSFDLSFGDLDRHPPPKRAVHWLYEDYLDAAITPPTEWVYNSRNLVPVLDDAVIHDLRILQAKKKGPKAPF